MANKKHLEILKQGVEAWNKWRKENPDERPDLIEADLRKMNLSGANLWYANLRGANLGESDLSGAHLSGANLWIANLSRANLRGADLVKADLSGAHLEGANLNRAVLWRANLVAANLREAELINSDLMSACLINTNLENADLTGCRIYGISVWDIRLNETIQKDLIITPVGESIITVDNLEVAQFIYLLLHNERIRHVIETITSKVVLILGRFTPKRKAVLDAIREELRKHDYIPVMFDFDKPATKDTHETITTLARMAKFVIADITSPKSIPQELVSIVETLPSLPVQPLLMKGKRPWSMFDHIKKYPWVLAIHRYRDLDDLMATLKEKVIEPAEAKVLELRKQG